MARIVRLTESDMNRLVRRVIMEESKIRSVKETVYKFLDTYVGEGVNISDKTRMDDPFTFMSQDVYFISSDNNTRVIEIIYKNDKPSIVCDKRLGDIVSNFFSISMITSNSYISSWFKGRNGIKNLSDFEKLIAMHESIPTN